METDDTCRHKERLTWAVLFVEETKYCVIRHCRVAETWSLASSETWSLACSETWSFSMPKDVIIMSRDAIISVPRDMIISMSRDVIISMFRDVAELPLPRGAVTANCSSRHRRAPRLPRWRHGPDQAREDVLTSRPRSGQRSPLLLTLLLRSFVIPDFQIMDRNCSTVLQPGLRSWPAFPANSQAFY